MKAFAEKIRRDTLREKAEKAVHEKIERMHKGPKGEIDRLAHELGVHQIELEIQNEELRQAHQELETSHRRYTELYEFAPAGYFTFTPDAVISEVNQTGAILLGTEKRRLIGSAFTRFVPDPEDRESYAGLLAGVSPDQAGKAIDIKLRRQDGTTFYARIQFAYGRDPGTPGCCTAMVIDITGRRQLEDALRESEENYRLLFDMSPLSKWVLDLETLAFLEVNNAAIERYGYSREEFAALSLADIRTEEEFKKFQDWIHESQSRREKLEGRMQTKHRTKNGETIDVDVQYVEITYKGRKALLGAGADITARKRADQERERLITELQQFAYVASHDLQEPLRTVSSYVDLLALKYKGKLDQSADRYIGFAVEGASRMSDLLNDLLAFSRVSTQASQFIPINSGHAIDLALGNLRKSVQQSGAVITRDELPEVTADESQLTQLFQNLIANAIKFRRKDVNPQIRVSVEQKGNEWVFCVRDNGIGIESRFSERIFTIFQRLHTREEYPGTGVGLAICRRIVERHGGRIWVEAKPGEGSSFYFTLPAGEPRGLAVIPARCQPESSCEA